MLSIATEYPKSILQVLQLTVATAVLHYMRPMYEESRCVDILLQLSCGQTGCHGGKGKTDGFTTNYYEVL